MYLWVHVQCHALKHPLRNNIANYIAKMDLNEVQVGSKRVQHFIVIKFKYSVYTCSVRSTSRYHTSLPFKMASKEKGMNLTLGEK